MTDPSRFNDQLAFVTSWLPASRRTSTSVDARLARNADGTLGYAVSVAEALKFASLMLFGFLLVYAWLFSETTVGRVLDGIFETDLVSLIAGAAMLCTGAYFLWETCRPEVFDKRRGWYWRGWRMPRSARKPRLGRWAVRLELIHAVQLLTKGVDKDGETVLVHELNLVLRDGDRINLRCHGDQALLRSEARMICRFLDIPLWDDSSAV